MAGLIEVFLIVFLIFTASACLLMVVQRLAKKPLPVGCTPVNGECCQQPGSARVCFGERQRRDEVEVHDAGA
jgi:hypothetical protein